jgi:uncharacterized protein (DUF4415 family)
MSIVRYKRSEIPPLTAQRQTELAALAQRPDSEIDYSDIPPLDDDFWNNAAPSPFYRPVKKPLSVRIDADVIAWLKSQGAGYQSRINAILREAMMHAAPANRLTRPKNPPA